MHQILVCLWHELNWCDPLSSAKKQLIETATLVTLSVELRYKII